MTSKTRKVSLDNISSVVNDPVKPVRVASKTGRPKLNPYATEKKITFLIPEKTHRKLRVVAARTGKPMTELVVEALNGLLKNEKD